MAGSNNYVADAIRGIAVGTCSRNTTGCFQAETLGVNRGSYSPSPDESVFSGFYDFIDAGYHQDIFRAIGHSGYPVAVSIHIDKLAILA